MSYSEAITRNDLMGILDNIGYAKDDWTVPNITKNKAGNTEYTTTGGSPKTIMWISHHTNTGRFVILSRAVIKTSRYTSSATLYVDGNYVDSTGYNTTNLTTPVTVNPCGVFTGERDKTYTIELKIDAQDSGTTVTAPAYNPAQLIAIDILSTQSKGSRILECYPVGSYYETSDSNFNPNTEWGGTWVKETTDIIERRKLMWTSNAYTDFAAQTISMDLSNYTFAEVEFYASSNTDIFVPNALKIRTGENGTVILMHNLKGNGTNENTGARRINVSTSGVAFTDYTYKNRRTGGTLTVANQFCVPRRIYGIKQITEYRWHRTA